MDDWFASFSSPLSCGEYAPFSRELLSEFQRLREAQAGLLAGQLSADLAASAHLTQPDMTEDGWDDTTFCDKFPRAFQDKDAELQRLSTSLSDLTNNIALTADRLSSIVHPAPVMLSSIMPPPPSTPAQPSTASDTAASGARARSAASPGMVHASAVTPAHVRPSSSGAHAPPPVSAMASPLPSFPPASGSGASVPAPPPARRAPAAASVPGVPMATSAQYAQVMTTPPALQRGGVQRAARAAAAPPSQGTPLTHSGSFIRR